MKASTKQRLRGWADWILPPRVEELIATGVGRFLMQGGARNRDLKDRHADEDRVFVVGNGPSLNSLDISVLGGERTIVANSFYMHPDHSDVNPDYCCIGDYRFMRDLPNNVQWFRELEEALPETTFFVHSDARQLFEKYGLLKERARRSVPAEAPEAIAYARVSTEEQARGGVSLDAQRAAARKYCDLHGLRLDRIYADEGISGNRADNRPELQEAIRAACSARGVLVVYSLSRLALRPTHR